jgi:hypothetical protein
MERGTPPREIDDSHPPGSGFLVWCPLAGWQAQLWNSDDTVERD